jgi:hypothetical protein
VLSNVNTEKGILVAVKGDYAHGRLLVRIGYVLARTPALFTFLGVEGSE